MFPILGMSSHFFASIPPKGGSWSWGHGGVRPRVLGVGHRDPPLRRRRRLPPRRLDHLGRRRLSPSVMPEGKLHPALVPLG